MKMSEWKNESMTLAKGDGLFDRWCVREGMKQNWCGLIWINPGMQNFETKTKQKQKNKDLATGPDIRVVVETLFFFGSLQSKGRRKSRVNPRVFAGLSTAKTTILQFGLDDCAVRVGWFCSSAWTADSRHWLLSISNASSYLHRLLWAQKNMKPSIVSRLHIPKMSVF